MDRSQPTLLKSIEELKQFHGAVGNFEVVLDIEKDVSYLPSFVAGERSLFVAGGTVNAFVDFSELSNGAIKLSDDGKSATIELPEAQLDKPNLDHERTYLFDKDRGLANRVGSLFSDGDQSEFYKKAEDKLAAAAKQSELRDQAMSNTKAMLEGLGGSFGVAVTFVEPDGAPSNDASESADSGS